MRLVAGTETPGLYTIATAVVDYRGFRIVAQSIIPGILQGEQLGQLIYGFVDNGSKFVWNADLHDKLAAAGQALLLKPHTIQDSSGTQHTVCLPVDCKGILGTDNRMYLLDINRITPGDPYEDSARCRGAGEPEGGSGKGTAGEGKVEVEGAGVLRPELLQQFAYQRKVQASAAEPRAKGRAGGEDAPGAAAGDAGDAGAEGAEEAEAGEEVQFNVNLFGAGGHGGPGLQWSVVGGGVEEDEAAVRAASAMLREEVIPACVERFRALDPAPVDGQQLAETLHSQGINIRCLGAVCAAAGPEAADVAYVVGLCEREMLARGCKHVLRHGLARTGPSLLAPACAHALNCLLGRVGEAGHPTSAKAKKREKKAAVAAAGRGGRGGPACAEGDCPGPLLAATSESFWEAVRAEVRARFRFELPGGADGRAATLARVHAMPLLRAICQRTGLCVKARALDLSSAAPLSALDILGINPVATGAVFVCKEGRDLLAAGNG